jgi:hypothetical protein
MGWMERHEQVGEAAATPAGRVVVGRHRLLGTEQLLVLPTADGLARLLPALRKLAAAAPAGVAPYVDCALTPEPCLIAARPAGGLLADALAEELPLPFLTVARWLEPLLAALLRLHEAGLVHGNISAATVGFDGEGRARWLLPCLLAPGGTFTPEAALLLPAPVVTGAADYDGSADVAALASLALCAVWGRFRAGETHAFSLLPGIPQTLAAQLDTLRLWPCGGAAPQVALALLTDWLEAVDVGAESPVDVTHDDSMPLPVPSAERALSIAATASHGALASMPNHPASEEVEVTTAAAPKTSSYSVAQIRGGFDTSAGLALPGPSALVSAARSAVAVAPEPAIESEEAAKALATLAAARKLFDL